MTAALQSSPALYPPTVTPPDAPLSLYRFLIKVVQNPLLVLPQAAYEQDIVLRQDGKRTVCWLSDPRLIEELLVQRAAELEKSPIEKRLFRRALGDGVLTAEGQLWRWQRRAMAPMFRQSELRRYAPAMARSAEEQLVRWRAAPQGSVQQIDNDMVETTFAVIARTMLIGGEPREAEVIKRATAKMLSHISWEVLYGALDLPEWLPHPWSWSAANSARTLRRAVGDILDRRQSEAPAEDLLGRLMAARDPESGEPMNREQIINNLLTLLEAGHETTSRALSWTLYLLARSPEWQMRAREEIRAVAGDGPIDADHIAQLRITQQVLKESMRLYAPVSVISRKTLREMEIGGEKLAKNSLIIIPIFCIHRHRRLWTDPDRFDPERFAAEKEASIPRTQFMPFGAGSRICIGSSFAMMEATIILATLIRGAQYDWDRQHLPMPISRVTLQPNGGMPLKVTTF